MKFVVAVVVGVVFGVGGCSTKTSPAEESRMFKELRSEVFDAVASVVSAGEEGGFEAARAGGRAQGCNLSIPRSGYEYAAGLRFRPRDIPVGQQLRVMREALTDRGWVESSSDLADAFPHVALDKGRVAVILQPGLDRRGRPLNDGSIIADFSVNECLVSESAGEPFMDGEDIPVSGVRR